MTRSIFFLLFILIMPCCIKSYSQKIYFDQFHQKYSELRFEKIYLHTDRNIYTINEEIWFKIYLVDGKNHIPIGGANNVYVDLVSPGGKVLIHKPFFVLNGTGRGSFSIGDSLESGSYRLIAYSNFQLNYGKESVFRKDIIINQVKSDASPGETSVKTTGSVLSNTPGSLISLQFMPEGGYMSEDIENTVAFRITTGNGKGINLKGAVWNSRGQLADSLKATHLGMGKIQFRPTSGMQYYAILDDYPADTFNLPMSTQKPQLRYLGINDSTVQFRLSTLSFKDYEQPYFVAAIAKGELLFYFEKRMSAGIATLNIRQSNFRQGLNQVILLDSNLMPLSERLIYIPGMPGATLNVQITKERFSTREKSEISFVFSDTADISAGGSLSVAAVNLDQIGLDNYPQESIISWLELSSEIRGTIEDPGSYFTLPWDSVKEQMDLLLLTQGWRKYIWDKRNIDTLPGFRNKTEAGFSVGGHAKKLLGSGDLEDGNIILFVPEAELLLETTTDSSGYFHFDNLILYDSTKIAVQSRNKKNKKTTRLTDADYIITPPPDFTYSERENPDTAGLYVYMRKSYQPRADNMYTDFNKTDILLDEVFVTAEKKKEDDGHFRLYSQASSVIDMDDFQNTSYSDLFMFLQGRVSGLSISGDRISIRNAPGPPLILLDGIETDAGFARTIPLTVVDKIEVLKDASNTAVFGLRGGNGVIAIYTKRGEPVYNDYQLFDIIAKRISGFAREKEFYMPDYDKQPPDPSLPDYRTTLFWAPDLIPDSTGSCKVTFFNSDDSGKIAIIAEGILNNGKPVSARAYYRVSKKQGMSTEK